MKLDIAKFLFSTVNASRETVLEYVGLDKDDEYAKRLSENEDGFSEVFTPHGSQYTSSGNSDTQSDPGRPKGNDDDAQGKQDYDDNYNENNR